MVYMGGAEKSPGELLLSRHPSEGRHKSCLRNPSGKFPSGEGLFLKDHLPVDGNILTPPCFW